MKLWLVVYVLGDIASTIGPLPGDLNNCAIQAARIEREFDRTFVEFNVEEDGIDGKTVHRDDISFGCVESDIRPGHESDDED